MIRFVNAKINIGLQIVRKREDGYHDLQTVFYPVGIFAGTAENPTPFCDILELSRSRNDNWPGYANEDTGKVIEENGLHLPKIILSGRPVECPLEKNLVYKAARLFCMYSGTDMSDLTLHLEKHLPDGAGMGGGSADAAFTLRMLSDYTDSLNRDVLSPGEDELLEMALRLGADCPFFIRNRPSYAEGVGERMADIDLDLSGYTLLVIKPDVYVSTKDAFAGVVPTSPSFDLRRLPEIPVEEWRGIVKNDFEDSIFPRFPEIGRVKEKIYDAGAIYSSMSGSGSSVYGIFGNRTEAEEALNDFKDDTTIEGSYLLKL